MFAVFVELRVADGQMEDFLPHMTDNATCALRDEPGCLQFDVCRDRDDPNLLLLYELYKDEAAFETHKTMPHYLRLGETAGHMITDRRLRTAERLVPSG